MPRQPEAGTPVADVCSPVGNIRGHVLVLKERTATWVSPDFGRLELLEKGNARLTRLVAELPLNTHILNEVVPKKALTPSRRREITR